MLQRGFKILGPFYCIQSGLNPMSFRGLVPLPGAHSDLLSPCFARYALTFLNWSSAPSTSKKVRGPCKNLSTAIFQTQYVRFVPKLNIRLNLPFSLQQAYFHAKINIHVPFNLKQIDTHSLFCTANCPKCYDSDSSLTSTTCQSPAVQWWEARERKSRA